MKQGNKNTEICEFDKANQAYKEYESLLAKPRKTKKESKRMERIYEALRKEAPYFLFFGD